MDAFNASSTALLSTEIELRAGQAQPNGTAIANGLLCPDPQGFFLYGPRQLNSLACGRSPSAGSRYFSLHLSGQALAGALPRGQALAQVALCGVQVWALRPPTVFINYTSANSAAAVLDTPVVLASRRKQACSGYAYSVPVAPDTGPSLAVDGLYADNMQAWTMCALTYPRDGPFLAVDLGADVTIA